MRARRCFFLNRFIRFEAVFPQKERLLNRLRQGLFLLKKEKIPR